LGFDFERARVPLIAGIEDGYKVAGIDELLFNVSSHSPVPPLTKSLSWI
jgi:hypothetical protein